MIARQREDFFRKGKEIQKNLPSPLGEGGFCTRKRAKDGRGQCAFSRWRRCRRTPTEEDKKKAFFKRRRKELLRGNQVGAIIDRPPARRFILEKARKYKKTCLPRAGKDFVRTRGQKTEEVSVPSPVGEGVGERRRKRTKRKPFSRGEGKNCCVAIKLERSLIARQREDLF